jgi:hypothetical protein
LVTTSTSTGSLYAVRFGGTGMYLTRSTSTTSGPGQIGGDAQPVIATADKMANLCMIGLFIFNGLTRLVNTEGL